jgi:5-formyltetrahydrofolate cyclo-ligase
MPSIRYSLRKQRRALTQQAQSTAADALYQQLIEQTWFQRASDIGFYWATDGEISPLAALNWCLDNNKNCYLPIMNENHQDDTPALFFQPYQASTKLNLNRVEILEPSLSEVSAVEAMHLQLIIVPMVGFNRKGFRLGMGGGYYDRVLSQPVPGQPKPLLVGVGHSCQESQFPIQPWDVAMDFIVTELEIITPPQVN